MSAHHCHAWGCKKPCPPKYLMCAECWALVPPEVGAIVYREFNPAQCRGKDGPLPSGPWMIAADVAILVNAWRRSPEAAPEKIRQRVAHTLKLAIDYARHKATTAGRLRATLSALLHAVPKDFAILHEEIGKQIEAAGPMEAACT